MALNLLRTKKQDISELLPHPASNIRFLSPDGIGIDGGGGELGVAEPFLHQVERDAGRDGGDAEAMAQPLGRVLSGLAPTQRILQLTCVCRPRRG